MLMESPWRKNRLTGGRRSALTAVILERSDWAGWPARSSAPRDCADQARVRTDDRKALPKLARWSSRRDDARDVQRERRGARTSIADDRDVEPALRELAFHPTELVRVVVRPETHPV